MTGSGYSVLVTGTDPLSRAGGIGFAMPGYLAALTAAGIDYRVAVTYRPGKVRDKWWPWLRSLPLIVAAAASARRYGRPLIVYSHAGAGLSLFREGVVSRLASLAGARAVIQLHCPAAERYLHSRWQSALLRCALAGADQVWVLTPWWRELFLEHGLGKNTRILPNPLPPEWLQAAERPAPVKAVRETVHVLAMARLEPGKGVDLVVRALPYLPEAFRLTVAGAGTELDTLRRLSGELGVHHRVRFTGWVDRAAKQALLDEADVFCLPTTNDSFGMGFLEAMANGLPVVALDWGPVADVVPGGRAGMLVEEHDPASLAAALERLSDPVLRARYSEAARLWVLERFAPRAVGRRMRRLFDELVDA